MDQHSQALIETTTALSSQKPSATVLTLILQAEASAQPNDATLPLLTRLSRHKEHLQQNRWILLIAPPRPITQTQLLSLGLDSKKILVLHQQQVTKVEKRALINRAVNCGSYSAVISWLADDPQEAVKNIYLNKTEQSNKSLSSPSISEQLRQHIIGDTPYQTQCLH